MERARNDFETIHGYELSEAMIAGQISEKMSPDDDVAIEPETRGFFFKVPVSYDEDEWYFVSVRRVPKPD